MSEHAARPMTADEFLEWGQYQELRYELVDGAPVAMTGARRQHDRVVMNALGLLFNSLRGKPCQPFTADVAVRIPTGNIRRPDVGVDCGRFDRDATTADEPFLVIEVLSPSTRAFDLFHKLDEYKSIPSLCHIVMIDPDQPEAIHWSRAPGLDWISATVAGLDGVISIPGLSCNLDLATLYEGLTFQSRPRLVLEA